MHYINEELSPDEILIPYPLPVNCGYSFCFSDYDLNVGRDCSCEYLEQIIKSKTLEKEDVDYIFNRNIHYIYFSDNIKADAILFIRGFYPESNELLYNLKFIHKNSLSEYTITAVHEMLHIFYKLSGSILDKKTGDIVEDLIDAEAQAIIKTRPKLAKYIFNTCVMWAIDESEDW